MADGRRLALFDYFAVDGTEISSFTRAIGFSSDDDQIDASGFNPTGANTTLAGQRVDQITADVMISNAAGETHQVLWPLHRDRSVFSIVWRKNVNSGVSATNPELRGNAILPTWSEGATRGELEVATLTFASGDSSGFTWHET